MQTLNTAFKIKKIRFIPTSNVDVGELKVPAREAPDSPFDWVVYVNRTEVSPSDAWLALLENTVNLKNAEHQKRWERQSCTLAAADDFLNGIVALTAGPPLAMSVIDKMRVLSESEDAVAFFG